MHRRSVSAADVTSAAHASAFATPASGLGHSHGHGRAHSHTVSAGEWPHTCVSACNRMVQVMGHRMFRPLAPTAACVLGERHC